jgi:SAM-dependent methyltransferase
MTANLRPQNHVSGAPFFRLDESAGYRLLADSPVFLRADSDLGRLVGDPALADEWADKQAQLMRWTRDDVMFNEGDVSFIRDMYRDYFARRGVLSGKVLDIGGGWGLFRQWWAPGADGAFVVHDPGSERFMTPPPPTLRTLYAEGLARPGWFVEGFGEALPYGDGTYDWVMIAAALDHCADPVRVMAEARRVLGAGGRLMIIQGFDPEPGEAPRPGTDLASRLKRVLSDPRRLHRAIRQRILHRGEPHIHHFTRKALVDLIAGAGFVDMVEDVVNVTHGVSIFTASRGV